MSDIQYEVGEKSSTRMVKGGDGQTSPFNSIFLKCESNVIFLIVDYPILSGKLKNENELLVKCERGCVPIKRLDSFNHRRHVGTRSNIRLD